MDRIKIAYYISDTGWGHVTRSLRIIEEFLSRGYKVDVINSYKDIFEPLLTNYPESLSIHIPDIKGDPRLPYDYPFNLNEIKDSIIKLLRNKKEWLKVETERIERIKPDIIISDITPWAFIIGDKLRIPAIAITNINWWDEYRFILKDDDKIPLDELYEAYEKATCALILPFESLNTPFKNIVRIPIVTRKINWDRVREKRKELLTSYRPTLICTVTLGGHYTKNRNLIEKLKMLIYSISERERNILFIGKSDLKVGSTRFIEINEFTDFHELIAVSDFIIGKISYGILSEMVSSDVSGILFYRTMVLEDVINADNISEAKWGITIPFEKEDFHVDLANLFRLEKFPKSKRLLQDGTEKIMEWINRYV